VARSRTTSERHFRDGLLAVLAVLVVLLFILLVCLGFGDIGHA
jgi:hypothetical protein